VHHSSWCNYTESKKTDPFSFEHNFRKYCLILITLSLLQTEIICPQTRNGICHFTCSLLLHYLGKCNHIHFFAKTIEQICSASGNFVVVKSKKFWWYLLLTDFFDAASRRQNDVNSLNNRSCAASNTLKKQMKEIWVLVFVFFMFLSTVFPSSQY